MKSTYFKLLVILIIFYSCSNIEEVSINENEEEQTVSTKPNILLIIADDMGLDATPGYNVGAIQPNMPNLESLMTNGITFTNVWSSPLCSPPTFRLPPLSASG